jgi:A/G-specific adenine glycosylase
LCLPIPSEETQRIPSVTVFPMRKEKKASREEEELVCVVEWQAEQGSEDRKWLFVKRPERGERLWLRGATGRIVLTRLGLLAGLFEPPTIALPAPTTEDQRLVTSLDLLDILDLPPGEIVYHINDHREIGKIQHIFSHINMTYHIHHVVLAPTQGALEAAAAGTRDRPPTPLQRDGRLAVWLDRERVEHTNIGTGVKKVWAEIYGSWGNFTPREKGKTKLVERKSKPKSKRSAGAAKMEADAKNGKIVKKIMMPMMPVRKVEVGGDQG